MSSFLCDVLYPDGLPEDTSVTLWIKPLVGKPGHRYAADLISLEARAHEVEGDVYFTCGLQPASYRKGMRAKASAVRGIPGLWLDLDFERPGQSKPYPTQEEADRVVASLPMAPSVCVHSGGGYHLWWLFHEVECFDTDDELEAGAAAVRGWAKFVQSEFAKIDRKIDSTFDLARVLRLPGTVNHNWGRPVEVVEQSGARYNLSEFETWASPAEVSPPEISGLSLEAALSEPESDVLDALFAAEPRIKRTWDRQRPDLGDQSPSGYDLSLANDLVLLGLPPQDVLDLLVAYRASHGDPPKHQGYYESTIAKAQQFASELAQRAEAADGAVPEPGEEPPKKESLERIRELTGSTIQRIVVYGVPEDPQVVLEFAGARVPLGGGFEKLIMQPAWESAAMAARSPFKRLPNVTSKKGGVGWDAVKALFHIVWEPGQKVPEAKALDWVECAVRELTPLTNETQVSDMIEDGQQFIHGGDVFLRLEPMLRIAKQRGARYGTTLADVQIALENVAECQTVELESEGGIARRYEVFALSLLPASVTQHVDDPAR